jgi:hypothetical protein
LSQSDGDALRLPSWITTQTNGYPLKGGGDSRDYEYFERGEKWSEHGGGRGNELERRFIQ